MQEARKILYSPVSLLGLIGVVFNLGLIVFLLKVDALSGHYGDLVTWMIMPWLVCLGLVLIWVGMRRCVEGSFRG